MASAAASLGGGLDAAPPGGGITASGGDISADLGSTLGAAFDSAFAEDTPPVDTTPEPVLDAAPEPDAEPIPEPALDVAPEPDVTAPPVSADAPQYQLTADGKAYQVPKAEFATIQQAQKYHQQVSQLYPTVSDANQSFKHASTFRQIVNDWSSGTDQGVAAVMNHWMGGDHEPGSPGQRMFQQSFSKMAAQMPQALQKMNPQAYDGMRQSMVQSLVADAYEKASLNQRPEDFNADGSPKEGSPFRQAQEMDFGLTGKYQTELKRIDPKVREQQDFERRQQEFNGQRDQMQGSQLQDYNKTQLEGAKFSEVGNLIDKTLAKIKDRYTDIAYNDLRSGINRELVDAMRGQQTATFPHGIPGQREWIAEHLQQFNQLVNDFKQSWNPTTPGRGLEARAQAYRQSYINRANQYLPQIAAPRISTATRTPGAARTAPVSKAPQRAAAQPQSAPAPAPNKRLSSDEWQAELNKTLQLA